MNRNFAILALLLTLSYGGFSEEKSHTFRVKSSDTAIEIAKAAIGQEFGKHHLKRYKWFEATVTGDTWKVYAHPYRRDEKPHHGGSIDVNISAQGGTVLNIVFEM